MMVRVSSSCRAVSALSAACLLTLPLAAVPVRAQAPASPASAASAPAVPRSDTLPSAVAFLGPVTMLTANATLTLSSVTPGANGEVWILRRQTDGARASLRWSTRDAKPASLPVGTVLHARAMGDGWELSLNNTPVARVPQAAISVLPGGSPVPQ